MRVPRDYRTVYVREKRIPHGHLKKHWRYREAERRGRRGEWKERKHDGRDRRDHERDRRGKGRG